MVKTLIQAEVNLGVDRRVIRKHDIPFARSDLDGRKEAGRPPGREQLLGVGASGGSSWRRQSNLQSAIAGAGCASVPASSCLHPRSIKNFFKLGHFILLGEI
jgi:hypothetical protein